MGTKMEAHGQKDALKRPELVFTEKQAGPLLEALLDRKKGAVILADSHNLPKVRGLARTIAVRDNSIEQLDGIQRNGAPLLIAIGGCTVLDIARAAYTEEQELIIIPSILSTACISVDKAVIRTDGRNKVIATRAPDQTIISIPLLMETEPAALAKWSQSGFADFFARFGTSMDFAYRNGRLNTADVMGNVPDCLAAIDWVIRDFRGFDEDAMGRLARWLHTASLITIGGGLAVGGEHGLYYIMVEQRKEYTNERPTHGQLVGAGTLVEARIFTELAGDRTIYRMLRAAYAKLGIPLTFQALEGIGIERRHLVEGLCAMGGGEKTLLRDHHGMAIAMLDEVFRAKGDTND